jgi:hypothetical protein
MTRVNYQTLGKLVNIDERDLEFERVTNSIDIVDREYGVDVIDGTDFHIIKSEKMKNTIT